jgi:hypothetical protein
MAEIFPLPCFTIIPMTERTSEILGPATGVILLREVGQKLAETKADLEELQGPSEEVKKGIFVQKKCPFADVIDLYKGIGGSLPKSIKELAEFANSHGSAWVSAFCGVHQNMRLGKDPNIVQVACKAGDGSVFYAENEYVTADEADEILKDAVCIYAVKK